MTLPAALTFHTASMGARPKRAVEAQIARELTLEDLALFDVPIGSKTPALVRLRHSHHQLARHLAKGVSNIEASALTGYSTSRVCILQGDPAFQNLVAHYKAQVDGAFGKTVERMAALSHDALDVLQERLDEAPEMISTKDLLGIATVTLDRTGHGATQKVQGTVVHMTPGDIEALKAAAAEASRGRVIEGRFRQIEAPNDP